MLNEEWTCAGRDGHVFLSVGRMALWKFPHGEYATIALQEPVHKISFNLNANNVCALLSGANEVSIVNTKKSGKSTEFVNLYSSISGEKPFATFTNNGQVVIIDQFKGEVYKIDQLSSPIATFSYPPDQGDPVDICGYGPRGFVILTNKSKLVAFL